MTDHPLPSNLEAERSTLGSCLLEPEAILAIRNFVSSSDFYLEKHGWIYEAMLTCVANRQPPIISLVAEELRKQNRLEPLGGFAYLSDLAAEVPFAGVEYSEHYAKIVADAAAKRRLIELGGQISAAAYDNRRSPHEVLAEAAQRLKLEARITTRELPAIESGREIWSATYQPTKYLIEDLLPEGAFLLSGKPKTKKSWLALNYAYAIASGGRALGKFQAMKGDVLYIDLEMGKRRIHKRLHVIYPEMAPPPNVYFADEWPKMGEGFEEQLNAWLEERPYTRLIIVDTLIAIRPTRSRDADPYEFDKMYTQKLANFCQERGGLAILLIHHARKADASDIIDSASGTTGLTGGVDNTGVLQAGEEPGTGILHLLGRDIERDDPVHLRWDARLAQWNASDGPSLKISPEREKVLTLLDERPGLTPKEIAIVLDRAEPGTRRLLGEMLRDGLLRSAQGAYSLSDTGESVLSA